MFDWVEYMIVELQTVADVLSGIQVLVVIPCSQLD